MTIAEGFAELSLAGDVAGGATAVTETIADWVLDLAARRQDDELASLLGPIESLAAVLARVEQLVRSAEATWLSATWGRPASAEADWHEEEARDRWRGLD